MGKRNNNSGFDDDDDFAGERDEFFGGELTLNRQDELTEANFEQQNNSYDKVQVTNTESIIKHSATDFIKRCVKLFHKAESKGLTEQYDDETGEVTDSDDNKSDFEAVLDSIADVEAITLTTLLKQVRWADHLVSTLMRRLDAGGHMDAGLISDIISAQNNSLNMTLTISSYVRNIPNYIKNAKNELSELPAGGDSFQQLHAGANNMLRLEDTPVQMVNDQAGDTPAANDEFTVAMPQRGMKDMLKYVHEQRKKLPKDFEDVAFEDVKKPD